jgi:hypothetical protein
LYDQAPGKLDLFLPVLLRASPSLRQQSGWSDHPISLDIDQLLPRHAGHVGKDILVKFIEKDVAGGT